MKNKLDHSRVTQEYLRSYEGKQIKSIGFTYSNDVEKVVQSMRDIN